MEGQQLARICFCLLFICFVVFYDLFVLRSCFFPVFFQGYPSYGYFPAAAAGAGGPAKGIAGGGFEGAGNGGGVGGGNTPGEERSGSQPSAATYYNYTNGGGPGLDQHNLAGKMGKVSQLLRDAYTGRSGQLNKQQKQKKKQHNNPPLFPRSSFVSLFLFLFLNQLRERDIPRVGEVI